MNDNKQTSIQVFVQNTDEGCKNCKNFSSTSCPAFKLAMETTGMKEEALSSAIQDEQKGRVLMPCVNSTQP